MFRHCSHGQLHLPTILFFLPRGPYIHPKFTGEIKPCGRRNPGDILGTLWWGGKANHENEAELLQWELQGM